MAEKTIGERYVRVEFNPNNDDTVSLIKQKTAELINLTETLRYKNEKENTYRYVEFAQAAYEEAAMWAVKAATA